MNMLDERKLVSGPEVWRHLFMLNLKTYLTRPVLAFWLALGMFANNVIFFAIWLVVFEFSGDLRGWTLYDLTILWGIVATGFGVCMVTLGGVRHISNMVEEGEFDIWLSRPVDLLGPVMMRKSEAYAIGDIITGLSFVVIFGGGTLGDVAIIFAFGAFSGVTIAFVFLAIGALGLTGRGRSGIIGTIHEIVIITGSMPLHGLPMFVKAVLFTALPAGFISYLPAELVRSPSLGEALLYLGGSVLIWWTGHALFKLGVRRYASHGV